MNKSSLSKILGKNGLTGAELGRLAILNNVELLRSYHNGKEGEPFFTEDEINRTARNLTDYQKDIYGRYLDLYAVINLYFNIGNAMYQQAYNGFHNLMFRITTLYSGLRAEAQKRELPLIITEDKYKELKASSDAEAFTFKECYIDLFIEALSYYVSEYEKNPEADTLLKPYIDKGNGKTVSNKALSSAYITDNFNFYSTSSKCYYTLQDGTTTKGHTLAEYIEDFMKRPVIAELGEPYLSDIKEISKGTLKALFHILKGFTDKQAEAPDISTTDGRISSVINDIEDLQAQCNEATAGRISNFLSEIKDYFTGAGREDITKAIEEIQRQTLIIPNSEYPTQADLIQFWAYLNKPFDTDKANVKLLNDFEDELPDVVKAINSDLKSHKVISTALKGITDKDFCKEIIDWKALYDADIYTYRQRVEDHFKELHPEAEHGISVIVKGSMPDNRIKEGIYNAEIYGLNRDLIRPDFTDEDFKTFKENIRTITEKTFIPALKNLYAINLFYSDIQEVYEIEDLRAVYGQEVNNITSKIPCLNGFKDMILMDLYGLFKDSPEGKRRAYYIQQAFNTIDIEDLLPDAEQLARAKEVISDINNFKGKDFSPKFMYLYVKGAPDTLNVIK